MTRLYTFEITPRGRPGAAPRPFSSGWQLWPTILDAMAISAPHLKAESQPMAARTLPTYSPNVWTCYEMRPIGRIVAGNRHEPLCCAKVQVVREIDTDPVREAVLQLCRQNVLMARTKCLPLFLTAVGKPVAVDIRSLFAEIHRCFNHLEAYATTEGPATLTRCVECAAAAQLALARAQSLATDMRHNPTQVRHIISKVIDEMLQISLDRTSRDA